MKTVIATDKAPAALGPYSQAIRANGFVFASGQLGLDPAVGELVEGGIQAQTRQALENAKAVLEKAGLSLSNVVKTTVFLNDIGDFAAMNEIYGQYFTENAPARSAVQVGALPKGGLVEIEMIAAE